MRVDNELALLDHFNELRLVGKVAVIDEQDPPVLVVDETDTLHAPLLPARAGRRVDGERMVLQKEMESRTGWSTKGL